MEDTNILEIIVEKMAELGTELKAIGMMNPEFESLTIRTYPLIDDEYVIVLHLDKEKQKDNICIHIFENGRKAIYKGGEQFETL